jgi:predicted nucleic acid-binding protein
MLEKIWVFDTVSLSNFLLSDSVFLLEKRYKKRGVITSQVYDEISAGISDYPLLKQIDELIDREIFSLHALSSKQRNIYVRLITHLGKGEASCIATAKEQLHAIVVTDDRTARRQCSQMDILFTGTIGILKASFREGDITIGQTDKILQKMIKNGFYSPVHSIVDPSH